VNGFQTFFASGDVGVHAGVPTVAGRQQQQLHQPLTTVTKCASCQARGATFCLRTGAVRTCAVLWILCYAPMRVSYMDGGCPVCRADIIMVIRFFLFWPTMTKYT